MRVGSLGGVRMMYQDRSGRILFDDDLDELNAWEVEELGIHYYDKMDV